MSNDYLALIAHLEGESFGYLDRFKAADAIKELIVERDTAIRERDKLREPLRQCAIKFREYEALHAAKPAPEKAAANAQMAEMCEAAIKNTPDEKKLPAYNRPDK